MKHKDLKNLSATYMCEVCLANVEAGCESLLEHTMEADKEIE